MPRGNAAERQGQKRASSHKTQGRAKKRFGRRKEEPQATSSAGKEAGGRQKKMLAWNSEFRYSEIRISV